MKMRDRENFPQTTIYFACIAQATHTKADNQSCGRQFGLSTVITAPRLVYYTSL